jgi:hypothetical protein
MSEHRDAWRKVLRAPLQPPGTSGVSDGNTRSENRRLKEKNEHGLHPVIPPLLHHHHPDIWRDDDLKFPKT